MGSLRADPVRLRKHIGGVCGAAAAGIYLTSPSLASPLLPLSIALFWLCVAMLDRSTPSRVLLGLFAVIIGSAWLSVGFSWHLGGDMAQTLWLAVLTSVLLPLAWIRDIKPILQWLTPVWLIQAGVSIYQWLYGPPEMERVLGVASNQNAGAAFLLLGCVYLLNGHNKARWLILPLVFAMPFAGSRWVAVVAALVISTLFTMRFVHWRYIAVGVILALTLVVTVGRQDIIDAFNKQHGPGELQEQIAYRFDFEAEATWRLLIPRGFTDSTIHSLPWRMTVETGLLSGLAWVGATAYALWQKPRYDYRWWLLLTVALLSMMYYFTWIGPLGWAWWLLVRPSREAPRKA